MSIRIRTLNPLCLNLVVEYLVEMGALKCSSVYELDEAEMIFSSVPTALVIEILFVPEHNIERVYTHGNFV